MASTSKMDETGEIGATAAGQASKPTCIIVLGMAGSGKTTFVQVCLISEKKFGSKLAHAHQRGR